MPESSLLKRWRRRMSVLPWHRHAALVHPEADQAAYRLEGQRPWPGWSMLELHATGNMPHGLARVQLVTRHGCVEVDVPLRVGKAAKRLVWVPLGVRRITLQAMNGHGHQLCVRRVRWVWLTPWFAHERLARRLGNIHPGYRGLAPKEVIRKLHRDSVAKGCFWRRAALEAYTHTFARACALHDYRQWVSVVEPQARPRPVLGDREVSHWQRVRPLFSLLMPLDDNAIRLSIAAVETTLASLLEQSYPHWELCVTLPPDISPGKSADLCQLLASHGRINVLAGRSSRYSALSEQTFVASTGEGVLWLSPGDRLSRFALQKMAQAWNRYPGGQLFYADEDALDENGQRVRPRFKPEWNPDLLMASDYIGRPALYRRNLVWRLQAYQHIGRGGSECDTPELFDYALSLRFLAWQRQRPEDEAYSVYRLPHVLYHRSGAADVASAESSVALAGREQCFIRLVRQLLSLLPEGDATKVKKGALAATARVCWPVPSPPPLVSLLIPTRDGIDVLKPCVDSILSRTQYRHFELLILDNQSSCPDALVYLEDIQRQDGRVRVLHWPHPFNYSAINNFGVARARGELVGLINNDIEPLNGGWLTEMVSQACRAGIGCVGAKLYYPEGTIQHAGVTLGVGGVAGHAHRFFPGSDSGYTGRLQLVHNLSAVTAACLLVRRDLYRQLGGLNEQDLGVAFNDVDFCLRVREAGYRNVWTPYAELVHHESATRHAPGSENRVAQEGRESAYMKRTWGRMLVNDPAYNPNLTLAYEDFSLR